MMVNFFIQLIIFKRIPKILLEMGGRHPYARTSIHSSFSFKGNSKHLVTILFPKFNLSLINIRDCVRLCVWVKVDLLTSSLYWTSYLVVKEGHPLPITIVIIDIINSVNNLLRNLRNILYSFHNKGFCFKDLGRVNKSKIKIFKIWSISKFINDFL